MTVQMNNISNLVQKYRQAPWRFQRQWLGLFLLGVVMVAMVASIYLNVSARTTQAGRKVQTIEEEISHDQRSNADLETQLADLTSAKAMEERAQAAGFLPVNPDNIAYVFVPGFITPAGIDLSSSYNISAASDLPTEYTQSLFDWFVARIQSSTTIIGRQP